MDAQAAAETQYDEWQSIMTQHGKEDQIMTKKRRILFMVLALVFMISLATPAFAVTYSGSWGGVDYELTLTRTASSAMAKYEYFATVKVTVYGTPTIHLLAYDEYVSGTTVSGTGMGTATARMNNYGYSQVQEVTTTGEITKVLATAYSGTNFVTTRSY